MSAVKHVPDSCLPFAVRAGTQREGYNHVIVQAVPGPKVAIGLSARDAAFVAHASNAYERLVEQLKVAAEAAREEFNHTQTAIWLGEAEAHEQLLRDLGEAE